MASTAPTTTAVLSGRSMHRPPPLSFEVLTDDADKRAALRLVADSIAQQQQLASRAVIFHPLCLAALVLAAALLVWLPISRRSDVGTILLTLSGLLIGYLTVVRYFTSRYIVLAEAFAWKRFLAGPQGRQDMVLAARLGNELIAALVLRIEPPSASGTRRRREGVGSGRVRAWTTKLKYRNQGIGRDLLRLAVVVTRTACGTEAPLSFDPHHANSARPLHPTFNQPFKVGEARAVQALAEAKREPAVRAAIQSRGNWRNHWDGVQDGQR